MNERVNKGNLQSVVFLCNNWWQWMEQKLPPLAAHEQEKRWHRTVGGALGSQSAPNLHRTGQPTRVSVLRNVRNQVLNVLNGQRRHSKVSPLLAYLISWLKNKFKL